jgi:hypothetical protein
MSRAKSIRGCIAAPAGTSWPPNMAAAEPVPATRRQPKTTPTHRFSRLMEVFGKYYT